MPYFEINKPSNALEKEINNYFWILYDDITKNYTEVFKNDLPHEMSNNFRQYGALNQFNDNYHYFKVQLGTENSPRNFSHRYRTQIIAALLERKFDLDFEVHHFSPVKDSFGKYDDTLVYIIYGDTKEEVKDIHQSFHSFKINLSKRKRGEIR
jgi:hypothetical protein